MNLAIKETPGSKSKCGIFAIVIKKTEIKKAQINKEIDKKFVGIEDQYI